MDTPTPAADQRLALADDELLTIESDLPRAEGDLDKQADLERERYDQQILAALVAPSF
jgi:hypothetical protein